MPMRNPGQGEFDASCRDGPLDHQTDYRIAAGFPRLRSSVLIFQYVVKSIPKIQETLCEHLGGQMKSFLTPDKRKVALAIGLVLFAPFPFFVVALAGFWPPIVFLVLLPTFPHPIMRLLLLVSVFIYSLLAFLLGCSAIQIVNRYTKDKAHQWIVIFSVIAVLLCSSFFHIYTIYDAGGGHQKANILEFVRWITNASS